MLVILLLVVGSFVLPLILLKKFTDGQKLFVAVVILIHIVAMIALHNRLVKIQGQPLIIDGNVDAQTYYVRSARLSTQPPLSITKKDVRRISTAENYGYLWLGATFWTICDEPMLPIRLFKTMMFFIAMAFIMRVWRVDYGDRLAIRGFAFMSLVVTATFYYNYRNLKDSLVLTVFIMVMAALDTIFRPRHEQETPSTPAKLAFFWLAAIFSLYLLATLRLYTTVLVAGAVTMHLIIGSRMSLQARMSLIAALGVAGLVAMQGTIIAEATEMGQGRDLTSGLDPYILFHAVVAPIPWQNYEVWLTPFHWIYLFLLPHTLYAFFRHFRKNMNWHLFMVLMVFYVTGLTGSGARKRITAFPMMVGWVLSHSAYKKRLRGEQLNSGTTETDTEQYQYREYEQEYPEQYLEYEQEYQEQSIATEQYEDLY